jgi:uncharacterized protein YecT (DUF1311 family)
MDRLIFTTLIALALICPVHAGATNDVGAHVTRAYRQCDTAAKSNADRSICLEAELTRQKANLDAAFLVRSNDIDPEGLKLLDAAQQAWVTFRDADCKAQMIRGGSASGLSWLTCLVRLTADRAVEMETYGAW